jgi:protein O-mannosyl-transferase
MKHRMRTPKAASTKSVPWPSAPGLSAFVPKTKQYLAVCLLLLAACIALYSPVFHYPFINYDDDVYVTQNVHVQAGLTWDTAGWAFTSYDAANWHPLTWLSHAFDYQLFGDHAGWHHATNLFMHALNVVLLFQLLLRATGRLGPSLLVAAWFALHPLNVESVAWVAERKNVLSMFFLLLTLTAYGWYARKPDWRRYLPIAILFSLGLMSKPMVITLPFVLLLLDYWPLDRTRTQAAERSRQFWRLVAEKIPLFLLSAASAVLTLLAQQSGGAVRSTLTLSVGVRLENALIAYVRYLWKMLWPAQLALFYPHPGDTPTGWQLVLSASLLIGISVFVYHFRAKGYLVTGWLWFLGTLVPVIGIVQVGDAAMADRYAYFPLIGIFIMIAWGLPDLADKFQLSRVWRAAPALGVTIALALATHSQLRYWSSSYEIWKHTLAVTKNNLIAHRNLAAALSDMGRPDEAFEHFKAEAELNPHDLYSQFAVGVYLYKHGRLPEALAQFTTMARLTADPTPLSMSYAALGMVYNDMGEDTKAIGSFNRSLYFDPNQPNAHFGLGRVLEKQGRLDDAILQYSRAIELNPTDQAYRYLGDTLQLANRPKEALVAYQQALKISPGLKEALAPAMNNLTIAAGPAGQ